MASEPEIDSQTYDRPVDRVADLGYELDKLRVVPQRNSRCADNDRPRCRSASRRLISGLEYAA